jgi:2-amino-4-hydroxy-6-hydroxymethyldihydropteridine diphosphokinase/dihydropteroate synthase
VAIGIGTNLGDRLFNIQRAVAQLRGLLRDFRVSTIVESEAFLLPGSPAEWNIPFLNGVAMGFTDLPPRQLLERLKAIELSMAPPKGVRWGPRIIDLDLLLYGDERVDEPDLTVPHQELQNRSFALYPLAQLLPSWRERVPPCSFSRQFICTPKLVGIVNLTPDSFSDGGLYNEPAKGAAHALQLWQDGASLVDLGAVSTRPGAVLLSQEEEWARLQPVLTLLGRERMRPRLSIDTFYTKTALQALEEFGVEAINFLGERVEPKLAEIVEREDKELILMHRLTLPPTAAVTLPIDEDPMDLLCRWGQAQIDQIPVSRGRLILDPGIGFGKTAQQNRLILDRIGEMKRLGVPLLVGHSRKRFLSEKPASERDPETFAISVHLAKQGVDYLRVHNVWLHHQL